jgi:hypothetical protein
VGLIREAELGREARKRALPFREPFECPANPQAIAVLGQRKAGVSAEGPAEVLGRDADFGRERWERRREARRQRLAYPVDRPATLERDARATRRPV